MSKVTKIVLEKNESKLVDELVNHFIINQELFDKTLYSLQGFITLSNALKPLIHSFKFRIKDPTHLKDKLIRKLKLSKETGEPFEINKENLFSKITDLVGIRIIHLHTRQIEKINLILKEILQDEQWEIVEGPSARTWDVESKAYFEEIGIETQDNLNLYTSVHYIIRPNSRSVVCCEIQVRTLMEEVWGEVDHTINYPHKTESLSCREQIKALARATSTCSRLVDSIFSTYNDFHSKNKKQPFKQLIAGKSKANLSKSKTKK